jgi:hypothetical protein
MICEIRKSHPWMDNIVIAPISKRNFRSLQRRYNAAHGTDYRSHWLVYPGYYRESIIESLDSAAFEAYRQGLTVRVRVPLYRMEQILGLPVSPTYKK